VRAVPGAALDASELFDVDVDRLARMAALVAVRRLPDTVESGMPSTSALCAPVIRNRRSAAIACTRRSSVRVGCRMGVEERSSSPGSPPAR
jgi:hypothetical protein